jgi:putative Holliday junction resolvase
MENADKVNLGRFMSLDLGDKRIGVAISDPSLKFASGLTVIERASRKADFEKIKALVQEHGVVRIIVGLPLLAGGDEGTRAAWARDYAAHLAGAIGITVDLWDESLTTVEAAESLRSRGSKKKERKSRIDAVAAAFILQSYLDAAHSSVLPDSNHEA